MPYALQQAFQQANVQSTAAPSLLLLEQQLDYDAVAAQQRRKNDDDSGTLPLTTTIFPPVLVLRGQDDFVQAANSLDAWSDLIPTAECMTLAGTSHYGMVEQEDLFGSVVTVFVQNHDNDGDPAV